MNADDGVIAKQEDLIVAPPVSSVDGVDDPANDEGGENGGSGKISAKVANGVGRSHGQSFTAKPLTFLQEWLAVRRKGQDFVNTPMGYVCQGRALKASHPFFAARAKAEEDSIVKVGMTHGVSRKAGGRVTGLAMVGMLTQMERLMCKVCASVFVWRLAPLPSLMFVGFGL